MIDPRGTYDDGYLFARNGGKPSQVKDHKGNTAGYRQGPWLAGFRQAQIDMRAEARAKGLPTGFPQRYKMTSKGWKK